MKFYEFKKSFEDAFIDYFNKYFVGQKSIESVYLDRMRDCMKALLVAYGKFFLLLLGLRQLKNNTDFYKQCSKSQKSRIKDSIFCLEELTNEFSEILCTYCEPMTD